MSTRCSSYLRCQLRPGRSESSPTLRLQVSAAVSFTYVNELTLCCPEMLKKYRATEPEAMAPPPVPASNGKAKTRTVTVFEEEDEERAYAQGMSHPVPCFSAEATLADTSMDDGDLEEGGRFFGGGLNVEQRVSSQREVCLS